MGSSFASSLSGCSGFMEFGVCCSGIELGYAENSAGASVGLGW